MPDLRRAWDRLRADNHAEVPGVGVHALRPDGWFVREEPAAGSPADVANEIARVGAAVIDFLRTAVDLGVHRPN